MAIGGRGGGGGALAVVRARRSVQHQGGCMKSSVAVALVLVLGCAAPGPPGSGVAAVSSALEQPASQPGSQPASQPSSQPTTPPNCQYWECTQCAGGQHRVRAVGTTPGEG